MRWLVAIAALHFGILASGSSIVVYEDSQADAAATMSATSDVGFPSAVIR